MQYRINQRIDSVEGKKRRGFRPTSDGFAKNWPQAFFKSGRLWQPLRTKIVLQICSKKPI